MYRIRDFARILIEQFLAAPPPTPPPRHQLKMTQCCIDHMIPLSSLFCCFQKFYFICYGQPWETFPVFLGAVIGAKCHHVKIKMHKWKKVERWYKVPSKQLWQLCAAVWKSEIALVRISAWLMIARLVMAYLYLETENKFHIIKKKKKN